MKIFSKKSLAFIMTLIISPISYAADVSPSHEDLLGVYVADMAIKHHHHANISCTARLDIKEESDSQIGIHCNIIRYDNSKYTLAREFSYNFPQLGFQKFFTHNIRKSFNKKWVLGFGCKLDSEEKNYLYTTLDKNIDDISNIVVQFKFDENGLSAARIQDIDDNQLILSWHFTNLKKQTLKIDNDF